MQEGYRFLDEKRLLLAAEIRMAQFRVHQQHAIEALRGAIGRHGLEALSLYPGAPPVPPAEPRRYSFLGVHLLGAASLPDPPLPESASAEDPSPQARRCAEVFHLLLLRARSRPAVRQSASSHRRLPPRRTSRPCIGRRVAAGNAGSHPRSRRTSRRSGSGRSDPGRLKGAGH